MSGLSGLASNLPGARAMKFGYSNARAKAMKSALLEKQVLEQMIEAGSMRDLLGVLEATTYRQDLGEPSLRYSGADLVEFALGKHFVRDARKVLKFTPKEAVGTVMSVLEKWDVHNLKMLLLGKHLGHPDEEITPLLVPAGALTPDELRKMREQKDVESLVAILARTGYGQALAPLLEEYRKSKNIQPLLDALEMQFYSSLSQKISGAQPDEPAILGLVRAEIDAKNIMNILRGKRDGIGDEAIMRYFIDGGNMARQAIKSLIACGSIEELIGKVKGRYNLDSALEAYRADKSLVHFELELERKLVERGLSTLRLCILSPGAIVGYLYLKENEIRNIRKIVRAKEFGIPPEKLRESIILITR